MASEARHRIQNSNIFFDVPDHKWPIIYSPRYDISFMYLEKLHPFDSKKWNKTHKFLKDGKLLRDDTTIEPLEASENDLLVVHSLDYLRSLKSSISVAKILEIPPVALVPNSLVQRYVLQPFRFQTSGSILAGEIALQRGWAINLGGGFHHCSSNKGGGFCVYADITLTIKFMRERHPEIVNVMVIDLDAHQGNGYQRDILEANDTQTYILDMYNRKIYPFDGYAKTAIKRKVELEPFTSDQEYLDLVQTHVEGALNEFQPHIVIYNAGTDILDGDPLGNLAVSPNGVKIRDYIVFNAVRSRNIPIIMLTSGGYMQSNARIIANSILNLHNEGIIDCPEARNYQTTEPSPQSATTTTNVPRSYSESFISRFCFSDCKKRQSLEMNNTQPK